MKKVCLSLAVAVVLTGCAEPARIQQMTATHFNTAKIASANTLKNSITVNDVSGGKETNPLFVSNIGNLEFKQSLINSLSSVGFLTTDKDQRRYALDVTIGGLDQPIVGLDMTVTATVNYRLEEVASQKIVFSRVITTPYTANFTDALNGTTRLKLANEGAAKKNIEQFIDELSDFGISKQQVAVETK